MQLVGTQTYRISIKTANKAAENFISGPCPGQKLLILNRFSIGRVEDLRLALSSHPYDFDWAAENAQAFPGCSVALQQFRMDDSYGKGPVHLLAMTVST